MEQKLPLLSIYSIKSRLWEDMHKLIYVFRVSRVKALRISLTREERQGSVPRPHSYKAAITSCTSLSHFLSRMHVCVENFFNYSSDSIIWLIYSNFLRLNNKQFWEFE